MVGTAARTARPYRDSLKLDGLAIGRRPADTDAAPGGHCRRRTLDSGCQVVEASLASSPGSEGAGEARERKLVKAELLRAVPR